MLVNMTPEEFEKRILNFLKGFEGTLNETRESLKLLISIHGDINSQLHDSKRTFPSWQTYLETLVFKLILCSNSICELSEGTKLKSMKYRFETTLIDFSSIYILTRAALENFLTLDYIFFNELPIEERLFRFKLWEAAGLQSRQSYSAEYSSEHLAQKEAEKIVLEQIVEEIKAMPEYNYLNNDQRRKITKYGLARITSWNELIDKGSLDSSFYSNLYSLFSNYAHSEFISVLQIRESLKNPKKEEVEIMVKNCFSVVKSINAISIKWHANQYEECKMYFDSLSEEIRSTINIWENLGRKK